MPGECQMKVIDPSVRRNLLKLKEGDPHPNTCRKYCIIIHQGVFQPPNLSSSSITMDTAHCPSWLPSFKTTSSLRLIETQSLQTHTERQKQKREFLLLLPFPFFPPWLLIETYNSKLDSSNVPRLLSFLIPNLKFQPFVFNLNNVKVLSSVDKSRLLQPVFTGDLLGMSFILLLVRMIYCLDALHSLLASNCFTRWNEFSTQILPDCPWTALWGLDWLSIYIVEGGGGGDWKLRW